MVVKLLRGGKSAIFSIATRRDLAQPSDLTSLFAASPPLGLFLGDRETNALHPHLLWSSPPPVRTQR